MKPLDNREKERILHLPQPNDMRRCNHWECRGHVAVDNIISRYYSPVLNREMFIANGHCDLCGQDYFINADREGLTAYNRIEEKPKREDKPIAEPKAEKAETGLLIKWA